MPIVCTSCPLGVHIPPCPLASSSITITTTGTDSPDPVKESPTAIPGFTCIECGEHVLTVCNGRCITCAMGDVQQRGSWICGRCGVSNAPHVAQCTCTAEPVANMFPGLTIVPTDTISIYTPFYVDPPLELMEFTLTDVPTGCYHQIGLTWMAPEFDMN